MENSFYSIEELEKIGFQKIGADVRISKKASIYGAHKMEIGNNVRIDDFCILSGNIKLGSHIHIAAYCALYGGSFGIVMHDFSGLSSRCVIYAESDDYSGEYLAHPIIPDVYRNVTGGQVIVDRHVILGTGCSVMPAVHIGEGVAVGSMSLVRNSLEAWCIYAGIPCKKLKQRSKNLLEKEREFLTRGINT